MTIFGGCGGGSDSNDSPQPIKPTVPEIPNTPVETVSKCDRGVLLNSILPEATASIFDEPLYQLATSNIQNTTTLYAEQFLRDGQMVYKQYQAIDGTNNQVLDRLEGEFNPFVILNNNGLFTQRNYFKQNKGWPVGYIVSSKNLNVNTAGFNDSCSFKAIDTNFEYEKIDISGKKIVDIMPVEVMDVFTNNRAYTYLNPFFVNKLQSKQVAFTQLTQSSAVFPSGSFIYVPKTVVLNETQFYFQEGYYARVTSLDQWIAEYKTSLKYVKGSVFGLNVAYTVDANGNAIYHGGSDPAIEKDGNIYDGEWQVKGDLVSPSYGAVSQNMDNFDAKGKHAYLNASSYQFMREQILNYYK